MGRITASFVTSVAGPGGFPKEELPEITVVGRSNVGKSSLINALTRIALARTSAAPGKTRLANYYRLQREGEAPFHLVDLPGYGYARGGQAAAAEFDALVRAYFHRENREGHSPVRGAFLLVDSRHPGLDSDSRAWAWLQGLGVATGVVATKVDKLTRAERQRHLREVEAHHQGPVLPVSAVTGEGLDELWKQIASLLRQQPRHNRNRS
ncbi:MAG: ribosome biogenesis GTP-binding protein YihA/YsxC, partial [Vicinamibacterales bacterium]